MALVLRWADLLCGWLALLMGSAPSLGRIARGSTFAGARRQRQRIQKTTSNISDDLVNDNKTAAGSIFTDVDGATITFDMNIYRLHQVTLGGNRTLAVTNVDATHNQRFAVRLVQDGTGSRTVTWWSGIKWAGGSAPTLTTGASKADWFGFFTTGVGAYDGFVIAQNF